MPGLQPPTAIDGHCSAIDNENLYVYSTSAFQSLKLSQNATWSQRPEGVSVKEPSCVKGAANGDVSQTALYVIGGEAADNSYVGLQRFIFSNQTWETLSPLANVLQGRTNHGVAYLNESQSILVYAGSQPDAPSDLSSQTFLVSTRAPYDILSFTSTAPPLNNPIILPWNSSHAVMVGGSLTNTEVWTFGPSEGWQQYGTNLTAPLDSAARAVLIDGADGSKVLQVYNLSTSPNDVMNVVLQRPDGTPGAVGETVGMGSQSRKRKRDLTVDNWPSYNSTNAPTVTRSDSSVARDADSGMIAIAGGSTVLPVALFDQRANSWINAAKFFNSDVQHPLQASASSVLPTTPTATSAPATSSSAAGGTPDDGHAKMLKTLGIALGVICGLAALFVLILLFLRWRRMKAAKASYTDEKDGADRMSFADRGASFMKEAGVTVGELVPPQTDRYKQGHDSNSSLAIMTGNYGRTRNPSHTRDDSFESTARLVKPKNDTIGGESMEMTTISGRRQQQGSSLAVPGSGLDSNTKAERKRSSGWSKYFATSQPTGANGLSHIPSVYIKSDTYGASTNTSHGSSTSQLSRIPSSTLMAPLEVDFTKTIDGQRLSHVTYGSPSFSDSREDLARAGNTGTTELGRKASIVDPANRKSASTSISSYADRSTLSSTLTNEWYAQSAQSTWSPTTGTFKDHLNERPSSSVYANSIYDIKDRPRPSRGKNPGFFPGTGTSYRPSGKVKTTNSGSTGTEWAAAATAAARQEAPLPPAPVAKNEPRPVPPKVSVFPTVVPQISPVKDTGAPAEPANSDMSWLNLGLNKS